MFRAIETNKRVVESSNGLNWKLIPAPILGDPSNRELKSLFGVSTIQEVMKKFQIRLQTNDLTGLQEHDYVDGLDLSGIDAPTFGNATVDWNDIQKNNRFEITGINTYKDIDKNGEIVNVKDHIIFTFVNDIAQGRMNSNNTNTGGYLSSGLKSWIDTTFTPGLEQRLGIELYPIWKLHSKKGSYQWSEYKVWLLSEIEVFGNPSYGDETLNNSSSRMLNISSKTKKWNGYNAWWWTQTALSSHASAFIILSNNGTTDGNAATSVGGIVPAFCVSY